MRAVVVAHDVVHGNVYAGDCVVRGTNCYCSALVRLWKADAIALAPGDSVKLVLDPDNAVPELDEANNIYQTTPLFITSVGLTTTLNLSWAGGIGPFQVQCKDNFEQAEWRIVQTTLGRSATLPRTGARAFYRVYDEGTGVMGLNVFTSQPLYVPNQSIPITVESTRGGVLTVDVFDPKRAEGSNSVAFHQSLTIPPPPLGGVKLKLRCATNPNGGAGMARLWWKTTLLDPSAFFGSNTSTVSTPPRVDSTVMGID